MASTLKKTKFDAQWTMDGPKCSNCISFSDNTYRRSYKNSIKLYCARLEIATKKTAFCKYYRVTPKSISGVS